MKYVVINYKGMPTPILFPEYVEHNFMSNLGAKITSAAKVGIPEATVDSVFCHGLSISLGSKPSPEDDDLIIRAMKFVEL